MNNWLRSFVFTGFLCIGFFSCKASSGIKDSLSPKTNPDRLYYIIRGAVTTLGGRCLSEGVCELIPQLRPWINDVQFSLSLSGKGKELKLSNNVWVSLMGLYVVTFKNKVEYNLEYLLGAFVVAPLITTTYQYVTRPKILKDNNSNN
jgi:hypothetical protein